MIRFAGKIQKYVFLVFIFLLPVCSLGYFRNLLHGYRLNASIYPFFLGILFFGIDLILNKFRLKFDKEAKNAIFKFEIFVIYAILNTLLMSIILSPYVIEYKGRLIKDGFFGKILPVVIVLLIIMYVVYNIDSNNKLDLVMKIIYVSMFILIIYGYIQVLSYKFPDSVFAKIYMFIADRIEFEWGDKTLSYYVFDTMGRINLTTPEASEAAHIINIIILPLTLSSIINGMSIFKNKFLGILSYEKILFILSMPIIFFTSSSSAYVFCFIQLLVAIFIGFKNKKIRGAKTIIFLLALLVVSLTLINMDFFKSDYMYKINYYISKLFNNDNTSTNTRTSIIIACLKVFLKYPINGCGLENSGFFIHDFIEINYSNSELSGYLDNYNYNYWFRGPISIEILASCGVIGLLLIIRFFYTIYKKIKDNSYMDLKASYFRDSFIIYIVGIILQGFNNGEPKIIYQWAILGIFVAYINLKSKCKKNKIQGGVN